MIDLSDWKQKIEWTWSIGSTKRRNHGISSSSSRERRTI